MLTNSLKNPELRLDAFKKRLSNKDPHANLNWYAIKVRQISLLFDFFDAENTLYKQSNTHRNDWTRTWVGSSYSYHFIVCAQLTCVGRNSLLYNTQEVIFSCLSECQSCTCHCRVSYTWNLATACRKIKFSK